MTKHEKAVIVEHIIGAFLHIKKLSNSGEIDRLCLDGMSKLADLSDIEGIQKEMDEIRRRRIDPMA